VGGFVLLAVREAETIAGIAGRIPTETLEFLTDIV